MTFPQQNLLCLYRYDPLDRLISHTQFQASPLQRFYCKNRLATEIQGGLHHSLVQHDDLLLAQQQRQDDVLDTTLLATDLQRSILQTLKINQSRHSTAYSPYGHRHPENGLLSLLGFNGERPDPVTGHYLLGNGYRAFNPMLMRFNSPDSWSPFGKGGLNVYAYCSGDPVNHSDPTGHMFKSSMARIKTFFRKPTVRNAPEPNSLEGMDFHDFQELSTYLSQSDMDALAQVSHRLNENSTRASKSNLVSRLQSHKEKYDRIPPYTSSPDGDSVRIKDDGQEEYVTYPSITGVGSIAFKKLDPSIKGRNSLAGHNFRVRENLINKNQLWSSADDKRVLNVLHVNKLLRALQ